MIIFPASTSVLGLGAVWADNILLVGDETFANQRLLAQRTQKALVVPVAVLEGDKLGAAAALTNDGCCAGRTALGEELGVASGAVGLLLLQCELLTGQRRVAVGAEETLLVIGRVFVRDTVGGDDICQKDIHTYIYIRC